MTTATQDFSSFSAAKKAEKAPLSLAAFISTILLVDLRESLAATRNDDQASAEFAYGL